MPGLQFEHGIALFFTRTYNRLLRPTLAATIPTLGAVATPLQRAFDALTVEIDTTTRKAQMASQKLTHLPQVFSVKHG